jgi:methyl-accepting chemotaxis protein
MARRIRRIKLIRPGLQLKLVGWFLAVTSIGLLLQYMLFGALLSELAASLPDSGADLMSEVDRLLMRSLLISVAIVLPLTLAVGILQTFRFAGPVHRFEEHLTRVARGEETDPCRIREGDELQELCERINQAVATLRARAASDRRASEEPTAPRRSAG